MYTVDRSLLRPTHIWEYMYTVDRSLLRPQKYLGIYVYSRQITAQTPNIFGNICIQQIDHCLDPKHIWEFMYTVDRSLLRPQTYLGIYDTIDRSLLRPQTYLGIYVYSRQINAQTPKIFGNICIQQIDHCLDPKHIGEYMYTIDRSLLRPQTHLGIYVNSRQITAQTPNIFGNICMQQIHQCLDPKHIWEYMYTIDRSLLRPQTYWGIYVYNRQIIAQTPNTFGNICIQQIDHCLDPKHIWEYM